MRTRIWHEHPAVWLLAGIVLISFIVRIRLLGAPLERDEGEHACMARTILAGNPPWKLAYNMKLPGTDALYTLFLGAFGQTAAAIRLGLLIFNTATILLIALLGRRLFGTEAGLTAGAFYGVLSMSQDVVGTIAHSTHFVAFFATLATLLLLRARLNAGQLFCSGLVYGVCFLMKQPGLGFAAFGALYVMWRWRHERRPVSGGVKALAAFVFGVVLPYALVCFALWRAGVFGRFWYWTVTLLRAYALQPALIGPLQNLLHFLPIVVYPNLGIWLLAALGLCLACWNRSTRPSGIFTGVLLIFGFLAVSVGFNFNPNYFIMMFPPLALAGGAWVVSAQQMGERALGGRAREYTRGFPLLCVAVACIYSLAAQYAYLFRMTPFEFARTSYGLNPFPEAVEIAEYIRTHSASDARVAVLGSEPEIYFYSGRRAATGYMFMYGLMEEHGYAASGQLEMANEIEAAKPEYLVFVNVPASWLVRTRSSTAIFEWMENYTNQYYRLMGLAEMRKNQPSRYVWGPAAATYERTALNTLLVFRRNP